MPKITRRKFIKLAASLGATLTLRSANVRASGISWNERREFYPQGVASADPHPDSVIVWTRRPPVSNSVAKELTVEIAEDSAFRQIVAVSKARLSAESDWTCRILAAGLKPRHEYWYRFTDEHGFGSRVGRTLTAPAERDGRAVSFAFVSCQNMQQGAANAYRRMIWEDEQKSAGQRLSFVLHLGDFVYEVVWYPEDRPQGYYSRRLRDVVRYEHGEKIRDFHVPTTVEDYRALYRAYLLDPDLQDARARWPFVCMWDNHEFSWKGWQSQQNFAGVRPAQTRKVAANQAWFEYQPARVTKPGNALGDRYQAPAVSNAAIQAFDEHGLGLEPGNLQAINSLKLFRSFRYGRNVELILTDNRSFRSEPVVDQPAFAPFQATQFPFVVSQDVVVVEMLDAGRSYRGGHPPEVIRFNGREQANPRRNSPPQSMLGASQKTWFLDRLRNSKATWKLWGNSVGMLDWRLDFQNLLNDVGVQWPTTGYAMLSGDDWSGYRSERAEILEFVRRERIDGFASIAGDRHSFQAGTLSESVPPKSFHPVGVEFVTGSVSAPGLFEAAEYNVSKSNPLRAIYVYQPSPESGTQPAINFSLMHGVRASLALHKTGDVKQALAVRNAELAPHLSFMDVGGHGYSVVRAAADQLEVEFVCIPRPLQPSQRADGGPLIYRVAHRVKRWRHGVAPHLERQVLEGTLPLVV